MDFGGEFRFNFGGDDASAASKSEASGNDKGAEAKDDAETPALPGEELQVEVKTMKGVLFGDPIHWTAEELKLCDGVSLMKADGPTVARATAQLGEHIRSTDLVAGEYEGGLKLWECAVDLVAFLANHAEAPSVAGRSVAELGCGHGLPGVFCALKGARRVAFQDYNACVLRLLTAPNLALNLERGLEGSAGAAGADKGGDGDGAASAQKRRKGGGEGAAFAADGGEFRFFSGDWGNLAGAMPAGEYDVILTSDSIYSISSQPKLLGLICHCLAKPDGVALVAAKTFYFGVGGGTRGFEALVAAEGDMTVETVVQLNDGASNLREIIRIGWKKP